MPMPNDALATVRQLQIAVRGQEGRELRLHGLLDEPPRARAQNFRERAVDFVFLMEGDSIILGHGVTLLREVRVGRTPTPLASRRHRPNSAMADQHRRDMRSYAVARFGHRLESILQKHATQKLLSIGFKCGSLVVVQELG